MSATQEKSCGVLDLDSTLVNIFGNKSNWENVASESRKKNTRVIAVNLETEFMWGTKRPYVAEFLDTCFKNFDLMIVWSAGAEAYVKKIVEILFTKQKPHYVFTRYDCVISMSQDGDEVRQKPLSLLKKRVPEIDLKRTLIFDDFQEVCEQDILNHIHVNPWEGDFDSLTKCDTVLIDLIKWMPQLKNSTDYRSIPLKKFGMNENLRK